MHNSVSDPSRVQKIADVREAAADGAEAILQGRIRSVRRMRQFAFVDIHDLSGRMQVVFGREQFDSLGYLQPHVLIQVHGILFSTKTGELSLRPVEVQAFGVTSSKEEKDATVSDFGASAAVGRKFTDLLPGTSIQSNLRARSELLQFFRLFLYSREFREVDTGCLLEEPFAGSAQPLSFDSKSLKREVFFRGTIELGLKCLVAGGWTKVFEIGSCGRNESPQLHEYLMLEAMSANTRSEEMLSLAQDLTVKFADHLEQVGEIDREAKRELEQGWDSRTFTDVINSWLDQDLWSNDREAVRSAFMARGFRSLDVDSSHWNRDVAAAGYQSLRNHAGQIFSRPTFVAEFPKVISPLAAELRRDSGQEFADRGYGFLRGWRIFEVVSEDMDPAAQARTFASQDALGVSRSETSSSPRLTHYLAAGAPPTAGLGYNINRFLGALLGSDRLEELTFFPLAKGKLPS